MEHLICVEPFGLDTRIHTHTYTGTTRSWMVKKELGGEMEGSQVVTKRRGRRACNSYCHGITNMRYVLCACVHLRETCYPQEDELESSLIRGFRKMYDARAV